MALDRDTWFTIAWLTFVPVLFAWMARDGAKRWHVVLLLTVAALSAVVAVVLGYMIKGAASLGAVGAAAIMLAAGMLAVFTFSGGVALALFLATRSEEAVARREELRIRRGDPPRPSMAPQSPREVRERIALSSGALSLVFSYGFVVSWLDDQVPNFLRVLGLFRGPGSPYQLSLDTTPLPFLLQTALAAVLATACAVLAWVQYRKSR